jgi:hypothetical protein
MVGLVLLHAWTPPEAASSSICLSRRLLGLPCPGCGMTRAFAHLAKGEWRAALAAHPFSPWLAAELVLVWTAWGAAVAGRLPRRIWSGALAPLLVSNLALLAALWMARLAVGALPR